MYMVTILCMHLLSPPFPFLPVHSPPLPALAVHDAQWYAVFTSQLTPEHTQLVQEMLTVHGCLQEGVQRSGEGGVE